MKGIKILLAIAAAVLCLVACTSSQTLTRSKATDILEKSPAFQPQPNARVYPTKAQYQEGVTEGFWTFNGGTFVPIAWKLTPSVERCFLSDKRALPPPVDVFNTKSFTARDNFKRIVIEITGITDAPAAFGDPKTTKVVDVKWTYDFAGCPDDIRKVFKDYSEESHDIFKLYDDGWRFVHAVGNMP